MIQPTKWSVPLGSGADVQDLPDDDLKFASFSKIFPQITQVPLSAGGVAPRRIDFNSLFKLLADNIYFYQNGGVFEYSDTADYEKGALVRYNDKIYLCIQDNSSLNIHAPTDAEYWKKIALNSDLADYLPLAGGNITGNLTVQNKNVVRSVNGVTADADGNVNVIVDYQNTNNGYIQFGNGLIFAWATPGIKHGGTIVNKPKPFTTLLAYITDQVSSRTAQIYYQACVPDESTNTTDTFVSTVTGSGNDGSSVFWIGKV